MRREAAQGLSEYALVLGLVSVAAIGGLLAFGSALLATLTQTGASLPLL